MDQNTKRPCLSLVETDQNTRRPCLSLVEMDRETKRPCLSLVETDNDVINSDIPLVKSDPDATEPCLSLVKDEPVSIEPDLTLVKPDPEILLAKWADSDRVESDGFDCLLSIKREIRSESGDKIGGDDIELDTADVQPHCSIDSRPEGTLDIKKVSSKFVPYDSEDRAKRTLPDQLVVKVSSPESEGASESVFTVEKLTQGTSFGPYEGVVSRPTCILSKFGVGMFLDDKLEYCIDGSDVTKANWMRYVQSTTDTTRTNTEAYQCDGQVFYRTSRDIPAHTELLLYINRHLARFKEYAEASGKLRDQSESTVIGKMLEEATSGKPERRKVKEASICRECGKEFSSKGNLSKHKLLHSGERPYVCKFCGCRFTQATHMQAHERTHTGEKPYTCSYCDQAFVDSGHLTRHIRIHTGETPFACTTCGKRFKESGSLISHTKIHSGIRAHVCSLCGKDFLEASKLKRHMVVHTKAKPFVCDVCDKGFTQRAHLIEHQLIHTGEMPHKCPHCDQGFRYRKHVKKHIEAVHEDS